MRHSSVSRFGTIILVGTIVLSEGLVVMSPNAGAAPPNKSGNSGTSTQNWDENLPSSSRFTVLPSFNNQAVRDNNTGLVWEQTPDTNTRPWANTTDYCLNKTIGGARGWRLPSVAELASLIDPSLTVPPFVPTSIFSGIQSPDYWSATSVADNTLAIAWTVNFFNGDVGFSSKSAPSHAWCVRGPMNTDTY